MSWYHWLPTLACIAAGWWLRSAVDRAVSTLCWRILVSEAGKKRVLAAIAKAIDED